MKPIFDPSELELSTEGERKVFEKFETEVLGYINGKIDGVKIRQETAACAVFAKKIQSRSAMAMIKYDREKRSNQTVALEDMRSRRASYQV
jgi:hypothetical protein